MKKRKKTVIPKIKFSERTRNIYLIGSPPNSDGSLSPHKIGIAQDVNSRLAGLQTAHWAILHVVGYCPGTDADEARFHKMFEDKNIRGEWFQLNEADVAQILKIMDNGGIQKLPQSKVTFSLYDVVDASERLALLDLPFRETLEIHYLHQSAGA